MGKVKLKNQEKRRFILILLMFLLCIAFLLSAFYIYKNNKEKRDSVYLPENAYVFGKAYTYAVSAAKEGDYSISAKGGKLFSEVTLKVNGILQKADAQENETTIHLNKGMNSITLEDGSKITRVSIKNTGNNSEKGAYVNYISHEAEEGETNAEISEADRTYREFASEASGRKYVTLKNDGDYISIKLNKDTNAFVLRYCIPDSEDGKGLDSTINFYVGDTKETLDVTSKYSWVYGNFPWSNNSVDAKDGGGHRFFDDVRVTLDKTYTAGTILKFQKDAENTAQYYLIDLVETEEVDAPIPMAENALNVIDFGAVPGDDKDDAKAISDCIAKAVEEKKEVYIPQGTFEIGNPVFVNGFVLNKDDITIRGAGMWHTILHGNAAAFSIRAGNISFYDFSLLGSVTQRKDSIDPPAFNMTKAVMGMENIHLQNIWMEHWKVGLWADVTNGIDIIGCRIRNTFADGINLCGGTSNCLVTNNDIRNTGDDGIAMFNRGVLGENNKIINNTVSLPWLANNIALYGGKNIIVSDNWLKDTICFGSAVNISTNFTPQVFEGTILVEGNKIERCGSKENNINADYGAIWVNTVEGFDNLADCIIKGNEITDSTYQGISFFNSGRLENMIIEDNSIDICGTYGIEAAKDVKGSVLIKGNKITNVKTGDIQNNAAKNFIIKK
jgi:hypothetical protein